MSHSILSQVILSHFESLRLLMLEVHLGIQNPIYCDSVVTTTTLWNSLSFRVMVTWFESVCESNMRERNHIRLNWEPFAMHYKPQMFILDCIQDYFNLFVGIFNSQCLWWIIDERSKINTYQSFAFEINSEKISFNKRKIKWQKYHPEREIFGLFQKVSGNDFLALTRVKT